MHAKHIILVLFNHHGLVRHGCEKEALLGAISPSVVKPRGNDSLMVAKRATTKRAVVMNGTEEVYGEEDVVNQSGYPSSVCCRHWPLGPIGVLLPFSNILIRIHAGLYFADNFCRVTGNYMEGRYILKLQ
jgi:hypothetical protein